MSGHSKWSTIKHDKAIEDKKKGKIFSKHAKAISVSVKEGGGDDPQSNSKLRLAIEQAKQDNMPKANIERAIEKGMGKGAGGQLESISYEGFGPEQISLVIESVSDNRNRTSSTIKSFLEKHGGRLGVTGSVSYMFQRTGQVIVSKTADPEKQILTLMDLEIEDVEDEGDLISVYTTPEKLEQVKKQIQALGMEIKEAGLSLRPKTTIDITEQVKKEKIFSFLTALEDLDDVLKVYCNVNFVK